MFWGSISESGKNDLIGLLETFNNTSSYEYKHKYVDILRDLTLSWFQSFCIQHAIISKSTLVSLPTGTGKTMTAIAYIEAIRKDYSPDCKALFVCIPTSVKQIYNDFEKYSNMRVMSTTGKQSEIDVIRNTPISFCDSYVVSYKALYNTSFCNWFVENSDFFDICVLDEAHEVSQDSLIKSICKQLFRQVTYRLELTATPLTVDPTQPLELINLMDDGAIENPRKLLEQFAVREQDTFTLIGYEGLENLSSMLFPHYVSWTRKELGIDGEVKTRLYLVDPTEEQMNASRVDGYKIIKMLKDSNQSKVLQAVVRDKTNRGLKGLVFCVHREVCKVAQEVLIDAGVKTLIANGENTDTERDIVLSSFSNNLIDCMVTNLTTSLNLSCDYTVIYEQTNNILQLLGRPVRGFVPRDIEVDYIITDNTVEIDQFDENVYQRAEYSRDMLGKDISVVERLEGAIRRRREIMKSELKR